MPVSGPITIILDSKHDHALKNALATALGGHTGKTFELVGPNPKKMQNRHFSTYACFERP